MKRTTATRTVVIGAAIALGLTACGSDSDSSGLSDDQSAAAQRAIDQAQAGGIELDEACVNEVAAKLSDDDAAKIVASGPDTTADLSPAGEALSLDLLECADQSGLIDLFVDGMNQSGQSFDEACLRDQLAGVNVAELVAASQGGDPPADLVDALSTCLDAGG
jgi:hypothetical protein